MIYSFKHFILVGLLALLAPLPAAHCAVLTFNPMATTNFDNMTAGQAITSLTPSWTGIGWTGTGASSMVAAKPAGTGNSSAMAINASGGTKIGALSPQQSLPSAFTDATTGDTLYFSAWLIHNGGGGSVVFNSGSSASGYTFTLGGFGITEGATRRFTYLMDTNGDGVPELITSGVEPDRNAWYEIALVIELDATDYANSLGSLYYRKAGELEFIVLPEFDGVKMSWWTPDLNATDFAYYRLDSARNNFQIDNLSVGMVIPEPSMGMLSGAALIALALLRYTRKK